MSATSPMPAPGAPLSERELEVLALVAEGLANPAIGRKLYLSEDTIKTHIRRILAKLEARTRTQAVEVARLRGLLPPPPGMVRASAVAAVTRQWHGRAPHELILQLRGLTDGWEPPAVKR